jgi:hypothetical protein
MKLGSIITLVLVLAGIAFTVRAFVANTSPYVKVAQLETRGQNVHLPLKPLQETAQFDIKTMTLTFEGEDETGRVKVVYPKGKPNNFEAASASGRYRQLQGRRVLRGRHAGQVPQQVSGRDPDRPQLGAKGSPISRWALCPADEVVYGYRIWRCMGGRAVCARVDRVVPAQR